MSEPHLTDAILGGDAGGRGAWDDGATRVSTRREMRARQRPPRRNRKGPILILLTLLLVVGALAAAAFALMPMVKGLQGEDASDYVAADATGKKVPVVVPEAANGATIAKVLQKAGVVKSVKAFTEAAKKDARSQGIQPGDYLVPERIPAAQAVTYLADPAHRVVKRVTIREGMRATEVYAALAKASGRPVSDYTAAAKDPAAIGLPAYAKGNVEGYLFPASYEFGPKVTPAEQLAQMVGKTKDVLDTLGVSPEKAERTVILASIIESEARLDADRGKVAQVLENRLKRPMRLQLDSTVAYATGKRVITTTDKERAQVNGYNTYTRDGLPVGPIGNPGEASLKAAAEPTPGPWLYFVTIDPATGETVFTTNLQDHNKAVEKFQSWCQAHKGQC
ncbi:endolytic transglycosylase MltG [Arsenicicoccus dermatophilus]|uniref:endolytic transglycosylase MltG n=1 Tax=Arsenicicoccus dermatophilus TaxID=1076331 RepID=UPI001F4CF5D4|nr:endolytic transglycosylase MltG [Arsenicicoccus dermatophilus]